MRGRWLAGISILATLGLAGCGPSAVQPPASSKLSFEEALARVYQVLPASRYVDNDLLPPGE